MWPEQQQRRNRLRAAIALVGHDPPELIRGDALDQLVAAAASAPAGARLVVVHSAVLSYLPERDIRAFVRAVERLDATWIAVEGPRVLPGVTALVPTTVDVERDLVVARDGVPIGLVGPFGQRYRALARAAGPGRIRDA